MAEILRNDPDWDIDTVLPDAMVAVETFKKGCGAVVPMHLQATAGPIALEKGDKVVLASGGGKVAKYAYTDAAVATDTLIEVVGEIEEETAGSAADDLVVLVRMI